MLLRCESLEPPMSQLGHSRRFKREVAREQPMKCKRGSLT